MGNKISVNYSECVSKLTEALMKKEDFTLQFEKLRKEERKSILAFLEKQMSSEGHLFKYVLNFRTEMETGAAIGSLVGGVSGILVCAFLGGCGGLCVGSTSICVLGPFSIPVIVVGLIGGVIVGAVVGPIIGAFIGYLHHNKVTFFVKFEPELTIATRPTVTIEEETITPDMPVTDRFIPLTKLNNNS